MHPQNNILSRLTKSMLFLAIFFSTILPFTIHAQIDEQRLLDTLVQENAAEKAAGYASTMNESVSLQTSIGRIINYIAGLIGTFLLVIIAFGGFEWLTAAGNDDQVTKAKESIQRAIVGALILLAAYAITQFVVGAILYSTTEHRNNASFLEFINPRFKG